MVRIYTILLIILTFAIPITFADDLRLDPNVHPTFQQIELQLDPAKADYTGTARIDLNVDQPTSTFKFHAADLMFRTVELRDKMQRLIKLTYRNNAAGIVEVTTATPLTSGAYHLTIDFENEYDRFARGLYKVEVDGRSYLYTQFEPWDARTAFPCWDEPAFKIPYQFILNVPRPYTALTNTPVEQEKGLNQKRITFKPSPPMSSYLLALAVGEFDVALVKNMSVPMRIITTKGNKKLTKIAADMTPPLLKYLETYFNRPYCYEKLDLIAVPEFWAGAMENPGAITFRESILLADETTVTPPQRYRMANIIAHELAHIWFGDLVTMTWWDDLWLNEAFATWLATKTVEDVYPAFGSSTSELRRAQEGLNLDAMSFARAIRQPISPEGNPEQMFDGLTYQKGQAIMLMFEQWIGEKPFQQGVQHYLKAHEWGNATAQDLWSALGTAAGQDVSGVMSSFLDQPGIPRLDLKFINDHQLQIRQDRVWRFGDPDQIDPQWQIPVFLHYKDGTRLRTKTFLLTQPVDTLDLKVDQRVIWLYPNQDANGYYRWSMPVKNMLDLADRADQDLTPRESIDLIFNLTALMESGDLPADTYLQALQTLADDAHTMVLVSLIDALKNAHYYVVSPELEPDFARYVRQTLQPVVDRVGLTAETPDGYGYLRSQLLPFLGEVGQDSTVIRLMTGVADTYLKQPAAVDPLLGETALSIAALNGDRKRFDAYQLAFKKAKTAAERQHFLTALGSFRSPKLVQAALDFTLTADLRPQEVMIIPEEVSEAAAYEDHVLTWLIAHYDTLSARVSVQNITDWVWFADGCSGARLARARDFFLEPQPKNANIPAAFEEVAAEVGSCVHIRKREAKRVANYLHR